MAVHSSIFAWRILWTKEPGRLQTYAHSHAHTHTHTHTHTRNLGFRARLSRKPELFNPLRIVGRIRFRRETLSETFCHGPPVLGHIFIFHMELFEGTSSLFPDSLGHW